MECDIREIARCAAPLIGDLKAANQPFEPSFVEFGLRAPIGSCRQPAEKPCPRGGAALGHGHIAGRYRRFGRSFHFDAGHSEKIGRGRSESEPRSQGHYGGEYRQAEHGWSLKLDYRESATWFEGFSGARKMGWPTTLR